MLNMLSGLCRSRQKFAEEAKAELLKLKEANPDFALVCCLKEGNERELQTASV